MELKPTEYTITASYGGYEAKTIVTEQAIVVCHYDLIEHTKDELADKFCLAFTKPADVDFEVEKITFTVDPVFDPVAEIEKPNKE